MLVNNAGNGSVGAVEEIDIDELKALHDTMFFGPVRLTQAVLPAMRPAQKRRDRADQLDGRPARAPGFGAYCSAKFALEAMSRSRSPPRSNRSAYAC